MLNNTYIHIPGVGKSLEQKNLGSEYIHGKNFLRWKTGSQYLLLEKQ